MHTVGAVLLHLGMRKLKKKSVCVTLQVCDCAWNCPGSCLDYLYLIITLGELCVVVPMRCHTCVPRGI